MCGVRGLAHVKVGDEGNVEEQVELQKEVEEGAIDCAKVGLHTEGKVDVQNGGDLVTEGEYVEQGELLETDGGVEVERESGLEVETEGEVKVETEGEMKVEREGGVEVETDGSVDSEEEVELGR